MQCARWVFIHALLYLPLLCLSQDRSFDTFISRISSQYNVDVAVAPELIPLLDSLKGIDERTLKLEDFLQEMLHQTFISYEIVDGNKVLLRMEKDDYSKEPHRILTGYVNDESGKPLTFAGITIPNSGRGTYTDEEGFFELTIKSSTSAVQINYLGYKTKIIPVDEFVNTNHVVKMETNEMPLDLVTIIVPYQNIVPDAGVITLKGYQFFSEEELLQRNTESLVNQLSGYTHFSSEQGIRLRSSEEENSLFVMDDIPVYDPYHFYNLFSPFNGHYFPSIEVYKNNVPVEHGGKIDGLIDLSSARENNKSRFIFDTDLLLTSAAAELILTPGITIKAGGRFSHTGLLNESLHDTTTANFTTSGRYQNENEWTSTQQPVYNFYDINLGINAIAGKFNSFAVSYFRSSDYLDNLFRSDLSKTILNHEIVSIEQQIISNEDWRNQGMSATWNNKLNDKTEINFQGFYSSFQKNTFYDAVLDERFLKTFRHSTNTGLQDNRLVSTGLQTFIKHTRTGYDDYTVGLDFQQHEVDLIAQENMLTYLLEAQRGNELTLFGDYHKYVKEKLEITIGGRMTYLQSTSIIYPQPQIQIDYTFDDIWSFKTSFSKNIQAVRELTVENRFGQEIDFLALSLPAAGFPILRSDKYMVGGAYRNEHFSLDGEFYYKKVDGLISIRAPRPDPSFQDATTPAEFYRSFIGDGWTAGFELLAAYKAGNYESSASYTISKISEQYERLFNGESFSPKEDRRHQLKLSSQYKMGSFMMSGLMTYKSKAPYVSFARLEGQGSIDMVQHQMLVRYLPPYFSLDLGVDYSFKVAKQSAQIGASIINITDHTNINDLQHVGRISKGPGTDKLFLTRETELLGRTFNLHFRLLLK